MDAFTPRASQVLTSARKEAIALQANCIGTEHLVAALSYLIDQMGYDDHIEKLFLEHGITPEGVRAKITKYQGRQNTPMLEVLVTYTPRFKKVLNIAADEAKLLNHHAIGTPHWVLAILRDGEGPGSRILKDFGIAYEETRALIRKEPDTHLRKK